MPRGLAGGLAALGATLCSGFEVISEAVDLVGQLEGADLVVTGEGYLDDESFHGKAVGGVAALAAEVGVEVLVIAGDGDPDQPLPYRSLVETYGAERARQDPCRLVEEMVAEELGRR